MILRVLGSAAGGGFPQWNCACPNCAAVRAGDPNFEPRTQDSVAVSADGTSWFLLNASPDILRQIEATPSLWPHDGRRSPIVGVVLTNGDIDHVLGLFQLREWHPFVIYATAAVEAGLRRNALLSTLTRFEGHTVWRTLELERETDLAGPDGAVSGLGVTPFFVPGKLPIHLLGQKPSVEDNVGLSVRSRAGGRVVYVTTAASLDPVLKAISNSDALLCDGTFATEDELCAVGPRRYAADMAHIPIFGPNGSLRVLERPGVKRKIYTHLNNTNALLNAASEERRRVTASGWEVASDGMTIEL